MMNGKTLSVSHYHQPQKQEKKLENSQKNGSSGFLHWTTGRPVIGRHGLVFTTGCTCFGRRHRQSGRESAAALR